MAAIDVSVGARQNGRCAEEVPSVTLNGRNTLANPSQQL